MNHREATEETDSLHLKTVCKRKAAEKDCPLQQIFDDIYRESLSRAANQLPFHSIESSIYKHRRLAQPALPSSPKDVDRGCRPSKY